MGLTLVLVTFPNEESAKKIVDDVLERKLAACILMTDVKSTYLWQGKKHNDQEIISLFKMVFRNESSQSLGSHATFNRYFSQGRFSNS